MTAGLAVGALTYVVLNRRVERRPQPGGSSLALGAFLDGDPGAARARPEPRQRLAASAPGCCSPCSSPTSRRRSARRRSPARRARSRGAILRLWAGVFVVSTLAAVLGYVVLDSAPDDVVAGIQGFAAGALIVMLVDTMIPDATRRLGETTGLFTRSASRSRR